MITNNNKYYLFSNEWRKKLLSILFTINKIKNKIKKK